MLYYLGSHHASRSALATHESQRRMRNFRESISDRCARNAYPDIS
jgi:hypothetical protein